MSSKPKWLVGLVVLFLIVPFVLALFAWVPAAVIAMVTDSLAWKLVASHSFVFFVGFGLSSAAKKSKVMP